MGFRRRRRVEVDGSGEDCSAIRQVVEVVACGVVAVGPEIFSR